MFGQSFLGSLATRFLLPPVEIRAHTAIDASIKAISVAVQLVDVTVRAIAECAAFCTFAWVNQIGPRTHLDWVRRLVVYLLVWYTVFRTATLIVLKVWHVLSKPATLSRCAL
jgi:hypothetical protein